jgi:hypothetical protein
MFKKKANDSKAAENQTTDANTTPIIPMAVQPTGVRDPTSLEADTPGGPLVGGQNAHTVETITQLVGVTQFSTAVSTLVPVRQARICYRVAHLAGYDRQRRGNVIDRATDRRWTSAGTRALFLTPWNRAEPAPAQLYADRGYARPIHRHRRADDVDRGCRNRSLRDETSVQWRASSTTSNCSSRRHHPHKPFESAGSEIAAVRLVRMTEQLSAEVLFSNPPDRSNQHRRASRAISAQDHAYSATRVDRYRRSPCSMRARSRPRPAPLGRRSARPPRPVG